MTNFLVKHFVRNYQNTEDLEVRTAYGILAGVVGIICNLFLFAVKFISGSLLHSVAVTADAFNNFSDAKIQRMQKTSKGIAYIAAILKGQRLILRFEFT